MYNSHMKLPEEYCRRMKDLLGDEYEKYIDSFRDAPTASLRVNTLKISPEAFAAASRFHLTPVPWCASGFYYDPDERPSLHPWWHAGLYYLQEASAMIPSEILPVQPGDTVLDACCAPGGKSTAIACRMHDAGVLVSNDISASRQNATLKNIQRFGISSAVVTAENLNDLAGKYQEYFDKILLDVPCSGEGMFRRDPSLIDAWLQKGPEEYASIQKEIVRSAIGMLKPGGMMVYSTCTFSPQEDEEIILYMKDLCPGLEIIRPLPYDPGFAPGILPGTENCIRLYPHRIRGEGHFAALLKKSGSEIRQSRTSSAVSGHPLKNEALQEFLRHVSVSFDTARIVLNRDRVLYEPSFDHTGIRTVRSGLLLGTVKKNSFEPSQHLAQYLRKDQFDQVLSFDPDDQRIAKYLKGETIQADSQYSGWVLVCAGDYPLGWGKITKGSIKNKIEPGFRKL